MRALSVPPRAALAALLLSAALAPAASGAPSKGQADTRPTVAVLYFDYQGKDEALGQLRKGLAQILVSDLSDLDAVRVVERDRLEAVLAELELGRSDKIDKATASRVGKLLGAKYLVMGGYFDLLGTLRVDARVVEVDTGKVVGSFGANGKADDFLAIEGKVASDLEALLTSQAVEGFSSSRRAAKPIRARRKPRAKKLKASTVARYGAALDAKDRGDKATAKRTLEAVVAEAPDFTLAQSDLDALIQ